MNISPRSLFLVVIAATLSTAIPTAKSQQPGQNASGSSADSSSVDETVITLRKRNFAPDPDQSGQVEPQPIGRHLIFQFRSGHLDEGTAELHRRGIRILEFVPRYAVSAYVPAGTSLANLNGLRWFGALQSSDKISRRLSERRGKAFVVICLYHETKSEQVRQRIAQTGASVIENRYIGSANFLVSIDMEHLPMLTGLDEVSFVYLASDALIEGKPVYFCPGPLTPFGPLPDYVTVGEGWDGPGLGSAALSYHFVNGTPDVPGALEAQEVRRALNTWSQYALLTWTETSSVNQNRSFDISWASGDHGDGNPFDGPGGVLAHCYFPTPTHPETIAGDMHFDEDEMWAVGSDTDVFSVALHEAGHGLGLGHSDDPDAVMYAFYMGVVSDLHSDDIAGIRSLYASAGGGTPPPNDQCSGATTLSNGVAITDSTVNATSTGDPSTTTACNQSAPMSKGVWYRFTPSSNGTVTVSTCGGSDYDTVLEVYTGSCGGRTAIACNDDNGTNCSGQGGPASLTFNGTGGTPYLILAASYGSAGAGGSLQIVASISSTPTPPPETISTPVTPSGPSNGSPGTSYSYSTGGSSSNLGHTVQYQFSWGDGNVSGWLPVGTTSASHSWSSSGTYSVRAQARCAADTSITSNLSGTLSVNIGSTTPTPGPVNCDTQPGIIIHDDGSMENGYSGNPANTATFSAVDKFTPATYPSAFSSVCVAFLSQAGTPTTLNYTVIVLDDDGAGGGPGTELGVISNVAVNIPGGLTAPVWQTTNTSSLGITVTSGSVYVGVRFTPASPNVFVASDESTTNPAAFAGGFLRFDPLSGGTGAWGTTETSFSDYRSLFVRAVFGTGTSSPTQLGNISTRLRVETGNNVLIGGFIVTGSQPKRVIIRAIGPSLSSLFAGVLTDPTLEIRNSSGGLILSNDDWRNGGQEAEIIGTGIPPSHNLESAVVATLPANNSAYTAIVRGLNNGTGIGVVEAYDLNQAVDSKLANISTRGLVQTGDNIIIGGLIVLGQSPLRVIVRAIGPSLSVPGALGNPTLELRNGNGGLIDSNDNWRSDHEAEIIATGVPPTNNLESAIVRNLNPGNYTAIVRGVGNTTGLGLVEAYGLN